MTQKDWDDYFITLAKQVSTKSKDCSTKVGVVVVGPDHEIRSTGYNGFPRNVNDNIESRHERPAKYAYTEHAERNAIYNAARMGVSLKGCTMYMNYEPVPCTECARAVIQSGIIRIVGSSETFPGKDEKWKESLAIGKEMLDEVGVVMIVSRERGDNAK